MFAIVSARTTHESIVVLAVFQGRIHLQVAKPPVAVLVVEVVAAILQKNFNGSFSVLANHRWIRMAALDIGETPDVAKHFVKLIGPLPGSRKRTNTTR